MLNKNASSSSDSDTNRGEIAVRIMRAGNELNGSKRNLYNI